ncbi:MAG: DNA polymerase III subunit gamma/tau [Paludibacteraceae bacterium]|nr:DNA polymerase III subunit gamma/tau [Paludibacteraceae bacterium]
MDNSNYIVSARKYRPMRFESVIGQRALTETLRNAIRSGHLAHAYLFCGPRGVGKTTCARIFAKTINCLNPTADHDACNECESCAAFNEQRSFNIHEMDAASNNSVEAIRTLIQEVRIPPQVGKYSVYIIDEVHMLSASAFNALLKTLEEPPSYAIFILATTEKHKVLPTILSRCQVYDFQRITVMDTIQHLQFVAKEEGIEAEEQALNVVAKKADGGMRDALSIFDQLVAFCGNHITYKQAVEVLNVLDTDYYFSMVDASIKGDVSRVLLLLDEVLQKGFDAAHFISGLMGHLRDVLVSRDSQTIKLLETSDSVRKQYAAQATLCDATWLFRALDIMNTCDIDYRTAKNKRLTVEIALIKLCQIISQGQISQSSTPLASIAKPVAVQPTSNTTQATTQPQPTDNTQPAQPVQPSHPHNTAGVAFLPKLPSINIDIKTQNTSTQTTEAASQLKNVPFTPDRFLDVWTGLKKFFPEETRLLDIISTSTPNLTSDHEATLMVANPWQKDLFLKYLSTILNHLRQELDNDSIVLEVKVEEYTPEQLAFTAEEKYKLFSEKNNQLADFKSILKLQLE